LKLEFVILLGIFFRTASGLKIASWNPNQILDRYRHRNAAKASMETNRSIRLTLVSGHDDMESHVNVNRVRTCRAKSTDIYPSIATKSGRLVGQWLLDFGDRSEIELMLYLPVGRSVCPSIDQWIDRSGGGGVVDDGFGWSVGRWVVDWLVGGFVGP